MKKFLKIVGYSFVFLIVLGVIGAIASPEEEVDEKEENQVYIEDNSLQEDGVKSDTTDQPDMPTEETDVTKEVQSLFSKEEEEANSEKELKKEKKKEVDKAINDIFSQAKGSVDDSVKAYEEIARLSYEASDNPLLMLSQEWKFAMGIQFGILKNSGQTFENIKSDSDIPEIQEIVSMYHKLGSKIIEAADVSVHGIDSVDGDTITRGAEINNEASDISNEITAKIEDLKKEHGL